MTRSTATLSLVIEPWPTALRLATALAGLALALGWEHVRRFRARRGPGFAHELRNLALWAACAAALLAIPGLAVASGAALVAGGGLGLLPWLGVPAALNVALTLLALDALAYELHRLYHRLPWLWRIHRVHHADERLVATTAVRFHPFEVVLSATARLGVVVALGADPRGVLAFEALLLFASQIQHAEVRLPDRWNARIRPALVTPNLHRIHHSRRRSEADSNYGTILVVWDRLRGTFRAGPEPEEVVIGLPGGAPDPASFPRLLAMPFVADPPARAA